MFAERRRQIEQRIARLQAEAERREDYQAIIRLQRAYGFYIDKGYWREASNLFAEDAAWNNWQRYFLGLIGGKDGEWAYANLGVFFALVLGFVVTWFARAGKIRRQEQM